jgi:hypothetical protein
MNCEELRDLYELYTLGLLDGEEREEIDTHLARGCEACRKSLGGAQRRRAAGRVDVGRRAGRGVHAGGRAVAERSGAAARE